MKRKSDRPVRRVGVCITVMLVVATLSSCASGATPGAQTGPPNIVFILTDDLASNLVTQQFMPNLWKLEHEGATFENYFVTDSLCCPSRSSIFTGRFPHDTGVFTNSGKDGGYETFQRHKDELSTVATDLKAAGYTTGMMGKYLNGYLPKNPVPPGWDTWDVAGNAYKEFNYALKEVGNPNGSPEGSASQIASFGGAEKTGPDNYLTDVLSGLATNFVKNAVDKPKRAPFFLELATFAPHAPFIPDPKYAQLYPGLTYPRTPAFDAPNTDPPTWLAGHAPLTHKELSLINHDFRLRAQDMKSVDNMIGNLVATLKSTGAWSDTCFVFSSDNGLHMGEHRLTPGKLTAFDTDIHVPLIVVGPGVHPDSTVAPFAENIDLRPTFDALAGTKPSEPVDGRSLLPLLSTAPGAQAPAGWPQGILVEHHGPDTNKADPDYTGASAGNPPSYEALRMSSSLYVVYDNGQHEYYNLKTDPFELDNIYSTLSPRLATALADEVHTLENCHDSPKCSDVTVPST